MSVDPSTLREGDVVLVRARCELVNLNTKERFPLTLVVNVCGVRQRLDEVDVVSIETPKIAVGDVVYRHNMEPRRGHVVAVADGLAMARSPEGPEAWHLADLIRATKEESA